jgi:hypothetical protein
MPPAFTLTRVGSALEDAKEVPVLLRAKLTAILERLAREGCRAADYALSGPPPWPHLLRRPLRRMACRHRLPGRRRGRDRQDRPTRRLQRPLPGDRR